MTGPHFTTSRTTGPGRAAVRHAARRGSGPPSLVTARYPGTSRDRRPQDGAAVAAGTQNLRGGPDGHAVLFYPDGDELAGQVSEYLLEAIRAGGVAVVIATPAHRDSIAAALAGRRGRRRGPPGGRPVCRAGRVRDDGPVHGRRLAQCGQLLAGDQPDHRAGRPRPGHPCTCSVRWLRCSGTSGRSTRPSRSRRCGTSSAAQYPFSLLCAYPAGSVRGDQHQDALAEVCRVHASRRWQRARPRLTPLRPAAADPCPGHLRAGPSCGPGSGCRAAGRLPVHCGAQAAGSRP